tara:strand:+ start:190 stop:480 length:291 start_codon:yes stop_codon:yes gene_type:complete
MTKKYKIKEMYINKYPHLKGVVFDSDDIDVMQDILSITMDIETAFEFEEMDLQQQCEFIGRNADTCGQIITVGNCNNKYKYTEFGGIDEFEEVKND